MKLEQLFLLHLMAGAGVAVCVYLSCAERGARWLQTLAAIVFWPLFLPLLLAHRPQAESSSPPRAAPNSLDELDRAIAQVEEELAGVLPGLEGWGESMRERAEARFRELRSNWTAQAGRVREMDQIMARTRNAQTQGEGLAESERMRGAQEAIRQNLQRLEELRQRTLADLFGMLAQVRQLVSLIHLARFSGVLPRTPRTCSPNSERSAGRFQQHRGGKNRVRVALLLPAAPGKRSAYSSVRLNWAQPAPAAAR